jgi:hypothetical protein
MMMMMMIQSLSVQPLLFLCGRRVPGKHSVNENGGSGKLVFYERAELPNDK